MRVTILGKRWNLRFARLQKAWGDCDHPAPGERITHKTIRISTKHETPIELADTVIHEVVHAAFPDLREETVLHFAHDLTRIMARLGFLSGLEASLKNSRKEPHEDREDKREESSG